LNSAGKCFSCEYNELKCGEECKQINAERIWMCNGQCQSWNLPCNGTCPSELGFWKCPFLDACMPASHLCNQVEKKEEEKNDFKCENNIHKARLVCDNPDKFDVTLNCEDKGLIQCPGNKTQQCIYGEDICNGKIDCIDRYGNLLSP
jgi:hypothetical protein